MKMKMKQTLLSIVLLCTGILSANVQAHSEGHGDISAGEAARIAQTSAQMLTFKDHGLPIGKLDQSWNTVSSEHYRLDQENNRVFVITAANPKNKDTLYFTVSKGGQLQSVTRKPVE